LTANLQKKFFACKNFLFKNRKRTYIEAASEKDGRKTVVLVDEYDKALVNTMDDPYRR